MSEELQFSDEILEIINENGFKISEPKLEEVPDFPEDNHYVAKLSIDNEYFGEFSIWVSCGSFGVFSENEFLLDFCDMINDKSLQEELNIYVSDYFNKNPYLTNEERQNVLNSANAIDVRLTYIGDCLNEIRIENYIKNGLDLSPEVLDAIKNAGWNIDGIDYMFRVNETGKDMYNAYISPVKMPEEILKIADDAMTPLVLFDGTDKDLVSSIRHATDNFYHADGIKYFAHNYGYSIEDAKSIMAVFTKEFKKLADKVQKVIDAKEFREADGINRDTNIGHRIINALDANDFYVDNNTIDPDTGIKTAWIIGKLPSGADVRDDVQYDGTLEGFIIGFKDVKDRMTENADKFTGTERGMNTMNEAKKVFNDIYLSLTELLPQESFNLDELQSELNDLCEEYSDKSERNNNKQTQHDKTEKRHSEPSL